MHRPFMEKNNPLDMDSFKFAMDIVDALVKPLPKSNEEKRCHICVEECEDNGQRSIKAKLYGVKSCCMICGKNTCSKHTVTKCQKCCKTFEQCK